ncbi:hypothetical protein CC78DRAFT_580717 [Lojkania enalia]|uniref:Uncharacterized protein n=1 Tax=Lojkania enalia TaxID=147567 RepID=A0A9P4K8T2_9PLEO|nr:hypothetical protein CC78DRAFT_580717 [Didymosphaeria enalia]
MTNSACLGAHRFFPGSFDAGPHFDLQRPPTFQLHPQVALTSSPLFKMAGFLYRKNNVPSYQREFQKNDGLRVWEKGHGRWMIPAYKVLLFGSFGASMYMMARLTLGHKTWFGKN